MIGYPVDDHFEPRFMCFFHQILPIFQGAKLRVYSRIILNGVIASQGTFSVGYTDRRDGHKPEGLYTHFF
ncbi:hypothetical protein D9M69_572920 [compost metagenome]